MIQTTTVEADSLAFVVDEVVKMEVVEEHASKIIK